jgi:molybdopterin-guanine dinucleotide biosynthesis protein A
LLERHLGGLVLAGGASVRMGSDKAVAEWLGVRAVDRVAALAASAAAAPIFCVGARGYGLPHVADEPKNGGPVGGILAGAAALKAAGCEAALVLAVDAPTLRLEDLRPLLAHPWPGAVFEGLHFPMVVALDALPDDARADWPVGRLAERAGLARLACAEEARQRIRGANTPEEREALLRRLRDEQDAQGVSRRPIR